MANFDIKERIKVKMEQEANEENDSKFSLLPKDVSQIKQEMQYNENGNNYSETDDFNTQILESLLVKPDLESDVEENYELSQFDIDKEFEKFNTEDEKKYSGRTVLENNTTAYKCQVCGDIFQKFLEYKSHKRIHFLEKRRCSICNIVCQSIGKLQDHLNKHLGLKPYECDECGKSFISKHHVKLHKRCHATEKNYKCSKCDKAFRNPGSLRSHQIVHAEKNKEFHCKICNKQCIDLPDFRKHMGEHGKKTEIRCGVCNQVFNSDRSLECHISIHKELKFPCEYCGKIYPSMYRIKRHIKRAHVQLKCDICDMIFYERAQYTKHKREHNENKPAECEFCQKIFDKAKNLSEHIRLQHKQDAEKKKCHICGKEFINSALLKNHIKTHDKCFKCPDCDRVFSSRYNLETHSVTHSGIRNHKCPICQKSFSTKSSLKNHTAIHSEERLFQCEVCAKTFKTNRRLYVHKFSHATEEKYQCEICLQKFRVKQYLNCHMNKHSKVKPFQCPICEKRFKHKKSMEKHIAVGKHKKKEETATEHDCDFCDESFPSRDLLLDHFADVHHEENVINTIEMCDKMMEDFNVKTEPNDDSEEIPIQDVESPDISVSEAITA